MHPEGDELATQLDDGGLEAAVGPAEAGVATAPPEPATRIPAGVASAPANGTAFRPMNAAPAAALAALWNEADRQRIRGRWQELQIKFLDDPQLVAGEAERLVHEAVASLTASLDVRRGQLHQQRAARGPDTEQLRASLRDYREFLDRILGL